MTRADAIAQVSRWLTDEPVVVSLGHPAYELFDPIPMEGKTEADVPELMARVRDALLS